MDHISTVIGSIIPTLLARGAPTLAELAPALVGVVATISGVSWAKYIKRHAHDSDA